MRFIFIFSVILLGAGCAPKNMLSEWPVKFTSPAFENNGPIPATYTCDGEDKNPPFDIGELPPETKSLVLIVDDPDAPSGDWVHWTLWNISPETKQIAEKSVPLGAVEGTTDFGKSGYGGPCPHSGIHRYQFKLYALDTMLELPPSAGKRAIEIAMNGHVLAHTRLIGLYQRSP